MVTRTGGRGNAADKWVKHDRIMATFQSPQLRLLSTLPNAGQLGCFITLPSTHCGSLCWAVISLDSRSSQSPKRRYRSSESLMEAPRPEGQSAGPDQRETQKEKHGAKQRAQHSKAGPAEEETTTLPGAAAAAVAAAAAGPAEAEAEAGAAPATSSALQQTRSPLAAALVLAAASAAGAALLFLLRRLRRQQGSSSARVQRAAVSKQQVVSAVLALREPSMALPPPAGAVLALKGRRLALSDRLDVHSLETRFGCELWKAGRQPAAATYWPADALLAAGVEGTATVFSEPLGLG